MTELNRLWGSRAVALPHRPLALPPRRLILAGGVGLCCSSPRDWWRSSGPWRRRPPQAAPRPSSWRAGWSGPSPRPVWAASPVGAYGGWRWRWATRSKRNRRSRACAVRTAAWGSHRALARDDHDSAGAFRRYDPGGDGGRHGRRPQPTPGGNHRRRRVPDRPRAPGQRLTLTVDALDGRELGGIVQSAALELQPIGTGDEHYPWCSTWSTCPRSYGPAWWCVCTYLNECSERCRSGWRHDAHSRAAE